MKKALRGCGLLNAAAEFPAHSAERLAVKAHKDEIENIISHTACLYHFGRRQGQTNGFVVVFYSRGIDCASRLGKLE